MSEAIASSGQNAEPSGGNVDNSKGNSVSVESHRRILAQLKRDQEELSRLKQESEQRALDLQKAEGKKDEVISGLEKKVRELEQSNFGLLQNFTTRSIADEVKKEALKKGIQPEKLEKFMKLSQDRFLSKDSGIQVNENFEIVNKEVFTKILEDQVTDNLDWFTKQVSNPRDVTPEGKPMAVPEKSFTDKSIDELAAML